MKLQLKADLAKAGIIVSTIRDKRAGNQTLVFQESCTP